MVSSQPKIPIHEAGWFISEAHAEAYKMRQKSLWGGHGLPASVLVAAIGNHWVTEPDCYEAVMRMCSYTAEKTSAFIYFYEVQDMCREPYDALGIMRNSAMFRALDEGFEYLCYVDNDIEPPEDTLIQLLDRQMEVIAPKWEYSDGEFYGLQVPRLPDGQGLVRIGSVVLSMLMFRTSLFAPYRRFGFWENPVGADEAYHFMKLDYPPYVDLNIKIKVHRPPHFPLNESVGRTLMDLDRTSLARKNGRPQNLTQPPKELWKPQKS